ncbi:TPA: MgtC/SapB family protein [Candidatus Woesearchaeota archaeon]|nr:MgtC/SapB family protein [Candidatus Woesearchaeota archaeon]
MIDVELLQHFLLAIVLGTLIGLEREYARYRKRGHDFAGIRTFPLIALFGALGAYLAELISIWILLISMSLIGLLIIFAYLAITRHTKTHFGATSEMAGFLTFFIGVLSYYGETSFALMLTIIITIILYARSVLHHLAERVTKQEMTHTLLFIVIAFLILPFLPDKGYGPYEIFNPFLVWLMVVFVSGISFIGYALIKWLGRKGLLVTAALGGIISSTIVATSFAARSKTEKKYVHLLALGVIIANGVMIIRVLIEVFAINRQLFLHLIIPLGILIVITAVLTHFSLQKLHKKKTNYSQIQVSSPFKLLPALKFALLFAGTIALIKIGHLYLSSQGVYLISFISGLANVDAITVSLSQLAENSITSSVAAKGILIGVLTNTAVKAGIAAWLGGKEFRNIIIGFMSFLVAVGIGITILM